MDYAELHCHSYYSFLDGTSSPDVLAERAQKLGLKGLALTDTAGLYGVIPFINRCEEIGLHSIVGSVISVALDDKVDKVVLLCQDITGYHQLSRLITQAHANAASDPQVTAEQLSECSRNLICLIGKQSHAAALLQQNQIELARARLDAYRQIFSGGHLYIELNNHLEPGDTGLCKALCQLAHELCLPCAASNAVHYAAEDKARLHDVMRCIVHKVTLDESDGIRSANHQRYLKPPQEMAALFREMPSALKNTRLISEQCNVEFDFSKYRFPNYAVPAGYTESTYLTMLCEASLSKKYASITDRIRARLREELTLIGRLGLAGYFLMVWDIVQFAQSKGIPTQGRGSAANSLVTYLLDITTVDPIAYNLVFARFLNEERSTIPDIDLDFASARDVRLPDRDDVLNYVQRKYGVDCVGLTCTFITFGVKMAIREIGKVFGYPQSLLETMSRFTEGRKDPEPAFSKIETFKQFDCYTKQAKWRHFRDQVQAVIGTPRHVSTHPGGMIITSCELTKLVPLQYSTTQGQRICQWDKDYVETAGLIKVDLLGLGILAVIRECLILIAEAYGLKIDLADINTDDADVYDMIARADTIGLFQIESRVQMQTLPRVKPHNLLDLAIEVAIIRPGPVQGRAVNPYIRRRQGRERIQYQHRLLEPILEETLGVVLFQEQIVQIACAIAGYTAGKAENLRRDLDKHRFKKVVDKMEVDFVDSAVRNGVSRSDAIQIFDCIKGFAGYGFCKSHALVFAQLAYQSAWLKRYYPAAYTAALINNQPLGFYPVRILIADAQRSGVKILSVNVNRSGVRCYLENTEPQAIRLSLVCVKGISTAKAESIVNARERGRFKSLQDFVLRTQLSSSNIENLIGAGAFDDFGLPRRELSWQLWILDRWRDKNLLIHPDITAPPLPRIDLWSQLAWEYRVQGFSTHTHPMQYIRNTLNKSVRRGDTLKKLRNGVRTCVAGLVVCIQKPATAKGVAFMLIEDEESLLNVIISRDVYNRYRSIFKLSPFVCVCGILQREGELINIQAQYFTEMSFGKGSAADPGRSGNSGRQNNWT